MIIDCISDLHGHYPKLEGGDLLIVAGDLTSADTDKDWVEFEHWIIQQNYREKIIIAGNHDNFLASSYEHRMWKYWEKVGITYLCDSGTELEYDVHFEHPSSTDRVKIDVLCWEKRKLKIWGSPWTKTFEEQNPKTMAFSCPHENDLAKKWDLIPDDVDILITHSPPFSIRDMTKKGRQEGSSSLMAHHVQRLRPKLWVFGHIHEGYGQEGPYQWNGTKYVNASQVNENYEPVNKPVRIEL